MALQLKSNPTDQTDGRDSRQNNCSSIMSEGQSAERPTAKKFISLGACSGTDEKAPGEQRAKFPQTLPTPLRTALIGFGKVGAGYVDDPVMARHYPFATHAQALAAHSSFAWEAVVDVSETALTIARERWNIPHVARTTRELARDYDVEVAVLATPPHTRLELLDQLPSLRAVLVEKPLGETQGQSAAFLAECARRDILVQVNLWRRADELFTRLANGLLHELIGSVQAIFGIYGNGLRNNGTHLIDFIRMLCGEVGSAQIVPNAAVAPAGPLSHDFNVSFTLTLESGIVAMLQPVDFAHYRENSLDIWGTGGRVTLMQEGLGISVFPCHAHRATQNAFEIASDTPVTLPSTVGYAFYRMFDNLASALFYGDSLCSPGDSALRTTLLVENLIAQTKTTKKNVYQNRQE